MCICTMPWTCGLTKWSNHTVAARHCGAVMLMTGCAPSAFRMTQSGFTRCCLRGWRNSTSRWLRRRPSCCGSAGFTPACGGASPFWDSSCTGCQIGKACRASRDARHVRSSRPSAGGLGNGSNSTGTCRGGNSCGG